MPTPEPRPKPARTNQALLDALLLARALKGSELCDGAAPYATQGSNPGLACWQGPRQVCNSHVRVLPWAGCGRRLLITTYHLLTYLVTYLQATLGRLRSALAAYEAEMMRRATPKVLTLTLTIARGGRAAPLPNPNPNPNPDPNPNPNPHPRRSSRARVLKSREAAEQLHCEAATLPCNTTRAAAARGGPSGYPAAAEGGAGV
eukprot:scaffold94887_cov69-Phaeocystis_antarctica.AAC.1